jgi:hypothetical protein
MFFILTPSSRESDLARWPTSLYHSAASPWGYRSAELVAEAARMSTLSSTTFLFVYRMDFSIAVQACPSTACAARLRLAEPEQRDGNRHEHIAPWVNVLALGGRHGDLVQPCIEHGWTSHPWHHSIACACGAHGCGRELSRTELLTDARLP